jgi:hypothetical protein
MSKVKVKETKEKNWTDPGVKLTYEEFVAGIKEAEEGPFMTAAEFKKRFYEWRRKKYPL